MRSFLNFKHPKQRYIPLVLAMIVFLILGFSTIAYSPAHLGHYAIPIPRLIPAKQIATDSAQPVIKNNRLSQSVDSMPPASSLSFEHLSIVTTFFWVGEKASSDNGFIANSASAWDEDWQQHYGGEDAPKPRNGYNPVGFTPRENPFYFALPYNDLDSKGRRKASASNCPLANLHTAYSWCKNSWIAIRHNGNVAYAQWQDVGPFDEDDTNYVFVGNLPRNKQGSRAGLDVSPALRDYLGLADVDKTDWTFVDNSKVPAGPWKAIITTSLGEVVDN